MTAEKLNFEDLPKAITFVINELAGIKELIKEKQQPEQSDTLLNVDEVADFLHLSKATIYSKVSREEIPYMKKGKRLYFSQSEMMNFIKKGRILTEKEIENENDNYLNRKGGTR